MKIDDEFTINKCIDSSYVNPVRPHPQSIGDIRYDSNGNITYCKTCQGYYEWNMYCENILVYSLASTGKEHWYAPKGHEISKEEFDKIYDTQYVLKKSNKEDKKVPNIYPNLSDISEFDASGNVTHCVDTDGKEHWWAKYDSQNNRIWSKNSQGIEYWYVDDGMEVRKEIFDAVYDTVYTLKNTDISHRKYIKLPMNGWAHTDHRIDDDGYEHWVTYNSNNQVTHFRNSKGFESWTDYDPNGHGIHYKDSQVEYWSNPYSHIMSDDEFYKLYEPVAELRKHSKT